MALRSNVQGKTYAVWHLRRTQTFSEVHIAADAGCLELRLGELVVELNPSDARAIAWRLLEQAEELERPLGDPGP